VTSPPGWHPDPQPKAPGGPALLRYWDGAQWTDHVSPAPPLGQLNYTSPYAASKSPTTPDGVPLAGWWHRVGAYLIDAVIIVAIVGVAAAPWFAEIFDAYRDAFDEAVDDAIVDGGTGPSAAELEDQTYRPLMIITAISLAVGFAYNVGFLMWKQATPGKLLTGLRVRRREVAGPMPLGTVVVRWLAQSGVVGATGLLPVVGALGGLYSILDSLWPLWDDKKQAIHDKIAKTNVVRVR
jgi:uncharacterized RDD family membrane protein YckC